MVYKKDLDFDKQWNNLREELEFISGKKPSSLNAVLFLIGIQELGQGRKVFSKEEKQDLMHIAICKVLSLAGYYKLEGLDNEGWPHWKLIKNLPAINVTEQEKLLKMYILEYFQREIGLSLK